VFESHAGCLGPEDFNTFLLPYITKIATYLKDAAARNPDVATPLVIFAKDAHYAIETLCQTPYDVIGLDWTADVPRCREITNRYNKTVQGNLDPYMLFASEEDLVRRTKAMLDAFGPGRHIVNLGHGIDPSTDPEKVKIFIDTVHSHGTEPTN
jgi:uroporphyrinogen decarboxylase